ncbi:hypothetical protein HanPI659440_Chr11g0405121 [Helianthus annuus]|nr:hypothetical protein HanPI659440_Chr11g0405121 [Helianthus annuus]
MITNTGGSGMGMGICNTGGSGLGLGNTNGSGMGICNTDGSGMGMGICNTDGSGMGMGNGLMGMECLGGNSEGLMNSGDSGKCGGGDSGSLQESMVLETCSSFGSINSAVLGSNLTTIGIGNEDCGGGNLMEKKAKVAAFGSVETYGRLNFRSLMQCFRTGLLTGSLVKPVEPDVRTG